MTDKCLQYPRPPCVFIGNNIFALDCRKKLQAFFFRINCKQFTIRKWNGAESSALGPTQPDTTGPITQPHVSLSSAANSCALACGRGPPAAARRRGGARRLRCPAEDDGPVVSLLRPRIHSHGPPSAVSTPGHRAFGESGFWSPCPRQASITFEPA